MRFTASLLSLVLVLSVSASAAIMESEPNDTLATADVIAVGQRPFSDVGVLSLGTGTDVDYLAIDLDANEYLTAVTTPMGSAFETPDTYIGLLNSNGDVLVADDNSGMGYGSMVQYLSTTAGTYYIAVTGNGDVNFEGCNHGEVGSYILTVSVVPVPEPVTLSLLAMSGLGLIIRKK